MKDEAITVDQELSLADQAVDYVLERIRCDVDLRWLMIDTEAWFKLCAAMAYRTGRPLEEVREESRKLHPHCAADKPRIPELIRRVETLTAELCDEDVDQDTRLCDLSIIEEAVELCPSCKGIPTDSINRCPMCRKLQEAIG